jgi:hypothetical protein
MFESRYELHLNNGIECILLLKVVCQLEALQLPKSKLLSK